MDNAAVDICVQVLRAHKRSVPLGNYQGAHLRDRVVRVCEFCNKLPNHLTKWLHRFALPPAESEIAAPPGPR